MSGITGWPFVSLSGRPPWIVRKHPQALADGLMRRFGLWGLTSIRHGQLQLQLQLQLKSGSLAETGTEQLSRSCLWVKAPEVALEVASGGFSLDCNGRELNCLIRIIMVRWAYACEERRRERPLKGREARRGGWVNPRREIHHSNGAKFSIDQIIR